MSIEIPLEGMEAYRAYQRRLARGAFTTAVMVGLVLYALGYGAAAKGLVLGALFSVLNFVIMAHLLPSQLGSGTERKKATGVAFLSLVLRWGLMAIPLSVGIKSEKFSLWAVVVGLFAVQGAIFFEHFVIRRWTDARSTGHVNL